MIKIKLILLLTVILLTGCFLLSGCGDDTTANMVAREQNRSRERQELYEGQNKKIVGIYQGSTNTADIFLTVETSTISGGPSSDGPSTVPTSTLVGSLIVSPKLDISSNNERVQYSFPFTTGSYDPLATAGGRLALQTTETNGSTENMNCDADVNHVLTCLWTVSSNIKNTKFTLKPSNYSALQRLSLENSADMVYTGHNDALSVMIEFDSGLISRDGSQIPQLTILGHMVFFDKNPNKTMPDPDESQAKFGFKNGTYDIFQGRITLTMDDDTQETLDCYILNGGQQLRCTWNARVKQVFTVIRTIRQ